MAKFFTPIPVAVAETVASLPAGAHMTGLDWNPETKCLEVHWEHQELCTPYTFPVAYSSDALAIGELPEKAWRRAARTSAPAEPIDPPNAAPSEPKRKKRVKST